MSYAIKPYDPDIIFIAIGRNEGVRLEQCVQSLRAVSDQIVYVDSDSTDNSVAFARSHGAETVSLDMNIPFTAARARNAGAAHGLRKWPDAKFFQFIDGDCQLDADWAPKAKSFLTDAPDVAVICGRRREKFPNASIYNSLADREWNTPPGPAQACGGDALIRISAFQAVQGYNENLIAGEEPEMCLRLREKEWKIYRLDAEMTLHDLNVMSVGPWWKRTMRAGHAFAEIATMHARSDKRIWRRESVRPLIWITPLFLAVTGGLLIHPLCWLILAAYPLQIIRLAVRLDGPDAFPHAALYVFGQFPEAIGVAKFWWSKWTGARSKLIEYKQ